eukprot:376974-Prymnesium_polylepis.1
MPAVPLRRDSNRAPFVLASQRRAEWGRPASPLAHWRARAPWRLTGVRAPLPPAYRRARAPPSCLLAHMPLPPADLPSSRSSRHLAAVLMCLALNLPKAVDVEATFDGALAHLGRLHAEGVAPPQCAYHALLRACSR